MRTITARFVMLGATAAVAPLLLYGVVSIWSLLASTRESVDQGNLNVARRAAEQVHRYVSASVAILTALAADLQNTDLEPWQQERILRNYVLAFPEFREITLFGESRTPIVSSQVSAPSVTLPPLEMVGDNDTYLSPVAVDDDLMPTTTATIRVTHLDGRQDWLVGAFDLMEIWRMVDGIRVGQQGYALILAMDGRLIAHGNPDEKRRIARGENLIHHPLLGSGDVALGESLVGEYSTGAISTLWAATSIPELGWTLIVEQPTAEAYAAARQLALQLIITIGLALAVTITIGLLWGRSFISPIAALMQATRAIADGRLDARVRIESQDEFRELGDSFNQMADRVVELQDDVRKQERQAVFGRIAAGLVHDLSHPIQNIGNSCKLILKMADDEDYRATFTRTVDREFSAIRRVLDGLRNLARPMPLERFPIDVNRSILEVTESMEPQAEIAGVTLASDLSEDTPRLEGDLFALSRVYRNLITNALQATPPGGRITIATERQDDRVRIAVSDTGCGIPPEKLEAIFEDFATTKRRGLGLGLAVCKKIVEQLAGEIEVSSVVGQGSTFTLVFGAMNDTQATDGAPTPRNGGMPGVDQADTEVETHEPVTNLTIGDRAETAGR